MDTPSQEPAAAAEQQGTTASPAAIQLHASGLELLGMVQVSQEATSCTLQTHTGGGRWMGLRENADAVGVGVHACVHMASILGLGST